MALYSEAGLPASYVALPFGEWQLRPEWPAVSLANTDPVEHLAPHIGRLRLIVLHFPKFSDGRAYSQARLLRERFGFTGELRATGHVLQDQLWHMQRSGFDAFEIPRDDAAAAFAAAMRSFTYVYQPTADGRVSALKQRLVAARKNEAAE